jgi:hypothetical protein
MNEEPIVPPETWEQRRDRARQVVAAWLPELETSNFQVGYRNGYAEGFNAGWNAYVQHLNQIIMHPGEANRFVYTEMPPVPVTESPPAPPSNMDMVLEVVIKHPGLRGVEIVQQLEKNLNAVPERSVRTCLHRLKKATKIKIVDGRWYAAEAEPANPQLLLREGQMDPP